MLFPVLKRSKQPWMTRQSVWNSVDRTRLVMYELTCSRRYHQGTKFRGARVCVHGATRHTGAALLMFNPTTSNAPPSETTIMELQQRNDLRTFRRHYCHAHEHQVQAALAYGAVRTSIGSQLTRGGQDAPETEDLKPESHQPDGQNAKLEGEFGRPGVDATMGTPPGVLVTSEGCSAPALHIESQTDPASYQSETSAQPMTPPCRPTSPQSEPPSSSRNAWRKRQRRQAKAAHQAGLK